MAKDGIKDEFSEMKKTIINKFQNRYEKSKITFGIFEVTLMRHKPAKDYICYFCDKEINDFYYTRIRPRSGYKKKICYDCLPKVIDFFGVDLNKWEYVIYRRKKRNIQIKDYLKAHEMD